jgi:hypothetical protein
MQGSLCPVTKSHIACFVEGRKVALSDPRLAYAEAIGFLSFNGDSHVERKLRKKHLPHIGQIERENLVRKAIGDVGAIWMNANHDSENGRWFDDLKKHFRGLKFERIKLNGADDVIEYEKWKKCSPTSRMIGMQRPGIGLLEKVKHAKEYKEGSFIIGPMLEDISSSAVRKAITEGDQRKLASVVYQSTLEWCVHSGKCPYKPQNGWKTLVDQPNPPQHPGPSDPRPPPVPPQPVDNQRLVRPPPPHAKEVQSAFQQRPPPPATPAPHAPPASNIGFTHQPPPESARAAFPPKAPQQHTWASCSSEDYAMLVSFGYMPEQVNQALEQSRGNSQMAHDMLKQLRPRQDASCVRCEERRSWNGQPGQLCSGHCQGYTSKPYPPHLPGNRVPPEFRPPPPPPPA